MQPASMMIKMANNPQISEIWDYIQLFIDEVASFEAILDNYSGSDFCQGIQFGIHGSRLIIGAGKYILKMSEMQWHVLNHFQTITWIEFCCNFWI